MKRDFGRTKWGRNLLLFFWISGLLAGYLILTIISSILNPDSACTPDGDFTLYPDRYSYWSSSSFFQITYGSGPLTFAEAKAIDIIWDVLVGRGGQAILALTSWQVFGRYVTTSMAVEPVTLDTFRTVFLDKEPTVMSSLYLIRDFATRRGLQSKIAMTFVTFTMTYILFFPTLTSAMTGYSTDVQAYIPDSSKNFLPFESFKPVLYIVHDGTRVNQTSDYRVTPYKSAIDVSKYGFFGLNNGNSPNLSSIFNNKTIDSPVLNISAYFLPSHKIFYGNSWAYPASVNYPFRNESNALWTSAQELYDYTYISQNGQCQSTKDYKWGASFIQLFVWMNLMLIWSVGIYFMWLKAHKVLQQCGDKEIAGKYKAVLELATAIQENLEPHRGDGPKTEMTEAELQQRIDKDLKGGHMAYQVPVLRGEPIKFRRLLWAWFVRDKWWRLACFALLVCTGTLWMNTCVQSLWIWSFGPGIGLFIAISICTTPRSRILFTLMCSIITAIPAIVIAVLYQPYLEFYCSRDYVRG
ncbi:hypothetical protein EJ04DRAFT_584472 [Polyplosphaeria fusca]|uniref:Uncharacterized protein n=1 Tax=Polyplosphaeria fusca TaxID=682080 RepID=A0A9P4V080_9PLEO|nr:hypothetical protein EJ04DRAFT_584472 [Polyplosphaeria fusca]